MKIGKLEKIGFDKNGVMGIVRSSFYFLCVKCSLTGGWWGYFGDILYMNQHQ